MASNFNTLALMIFQEVGFDIVSMWRQFGRLGRGVLLVSALVAAYFIGVLIKRLLKRQ